MAELMKLLDVNGAFKSDLIKALLHQGRQSSSLTSSLLSPTPQPADVNLNLSPPSTQSALSTSASTSSADNLNVVGHTMFVSTDENLNGNTGPGSESANISNNNTTNVTAEAPGSLGHNANLNTGLMTRTEADVSLKPVEARSTVADPNANIVTVTDVTRILSEVQESPSESRKLLVDQVTRAVVEAHMTTTINTHANVAEANERFQNKVQEMPDVYSHSINANNLWQHFMSAMLPEVTKVIKFCTKLPGFPEVGQEDKVRLIKQGCFEVMVTRFCLLVDHVNEEMFDPTLMMKASRQIVQDTPMGEFLDQFFTVASQINPLGLTDEEIGLFTAVLMLCPDREGLLNPDTINIIQQLFLQSLYQLLKQNHTDADQTLRTLINMMPVLRNINEQHLKFLKMIKMKSPTEFEKKFPLLHKELFDTTS